MKLPKQFAKSSDVAKREWVALELKKVRDRESELMKLSRLLAGGTYIPVDEERIDLDNLRPDLWKKT